MRNYYKPGTWNCICQVCGGKFKSDEVRKRWDGLIVCQSDYETRHILEFIRSRPETPSVPFISTEPADVFVVINYVETSQGLADIGKADFAKADFILKG